MATWNFAAVADAVIAFKKGITLQQGRALRDNQIAIAEGAAGAPRVKGSEQSVNLLGSAAISGIVDELELTELEPHVAVQIMTDVKFAPQGGSNRFGFVEVSPDNGTNWYAIASIDEMDDTSGFQIDCIARCSGNSAFAEFCFFAADPLGESAGPAALVAKLADFSGGINGVRIRRNGPMDAGGFSVYGVTRKIET